MNDEERILKSTRDLLLGHTGDDDAMKVRTPKEFDNLIEKIGLDVIIKKSHMKEKYLRESLDFLRHQFELFEKNNIDK